MQNFVIWTADNPQPEPLIKRCEFIANKIKFIAGQFNGNKFYISAADDGGELIPVHL